jgi:hypothetical protein
VVSTVPEFLQACHAAVWSRRPRDIPYRDSITIQAALAGFIEQTGIKREELADRLKMPFSKLHYLESTGKFNEAQLETLIELAKDYSLPNFAQFFDSTLSIWKYNRRGRNLKKVQ